MDILGTTGEPSRRSTASSTPSMLTPPPPRRHRPHSARQWRLLRAFGPLLRALPILSPAACRPFHPRLISRGSVVVPEGHRHLSGTVVTGTLFGRRRARVTLCIQENPRCLPTLMVELAIQTNVLLRELGSGAMRIAFECERRRQEDVGGSRDRRRPGGGGGVLQESMWTMFVNGKKSGYAVRREAADEELAVMELLNGVSVGAGVLAAPWIIPDDDNGGGGGGELFYVRADFEQVVGFRNSETFYMTSPDGGDDGGPDLTIFFVRV